MKKQVTLVKESYLLISKDFGFEEGTVFDDDQYSFELLIEHLTKKIQDFLNTDFNKLLNILYRIDFSETHVSELLDTEDPSKIAQEIAAAIVERQKQKVITRRQYAP